MARNGSGVYTKPSGTTFTANTTILSAKVNEVIDDLVTDANTARPVVAGGTGSATAAAARTSLGLDEKLVFTSKSAGYTAVAGDNNAALRFTGAYTLALTAAATLAANWHITVIADGGAVTVDPDASETIDGASTLTIPDGFAAMIFCTGATFFSQTILPYNSNLATFFTNGVTALSNSLSGLTLSNGTDAVNDIDIAVGSCTDSTNAAFLILSSALTKRLDASWAVGTGNGGLDAGSPSDTTYHVWLIRRSDTGVVDALFSLSATAPTMPTNYDQKRRIGSIVRSSAAILAFSQFGDEFLLTTPILDIDASSQGTTAISRTLTVPTGITLMAKIRLYATNSSAWGLLASSLDVTDAAPSITAAPLNTLRAAAGANDSATIDIRTNTSGQIRTRSTDAATTLRIATYGWIDTRGK